ncbi:cytochrome P450 [Sistotremastrum niveocremeum HHB9708]|uniref:Cytochrome P450 n=1 Tax=Sistotremastrum niveocremeum HHB9708 TaxID=1314777 RepID=A0A164PT15_9AGAM|nr:cytochrome P450 [Sistotremastrum niveocremeum HHB9708]
MSSATPWLFAISHASAWLVVPTLFVFYIWLKNFIIQWTTWVDVPAAGPKGILGPYIGEVRLWFWGDRVLQEGYDQYRDAGFFKVPETGPWRIFATSRELIDELRKAPDDELSFAAATNEILQQDFTMGKNITRNPYHLTVMRFSLIRNLGAFVPRMADEVQAAISERIPLQDDWVPIKGLKDMRDIITRVINRSLVGLPLCRDPEYLALGAQYSIDVMLGAYIIKYFPEFMKPLVARFVTNVERTIGKTRGKLRPVIEERLNMIQEKGRDYEGKPSDFLSHLIDEAEGEERTIDNLTRRILVMNFVSIYTTTMSFVQVLFYIAAMPEYVAPLREEIEKHVGEEGWTRSSLTKCRKLDSFVKECQRLRGAGTGSSARMAMKDYTFSNGTFVPKGTFLFAAAVPRHKDPDVYGPDAAEFDGFRFSNMREEAGAATKHHAITTSLDYLPFGHGRHACPGRFFAVPLMKTMLAYILLHYDVKLADGKLPDARYIGISTLPDPYAKVYFRRRHR